MRLAANREGGEQHHTFGEAVGKSRCGEFRGALAAAVGHLDTINTALQWRGTDAGGLGHHGCSRNRPGKQRSGRDLRWWAVARWGFHSSGMIRLQCIYNF
jgi:hypothetical protein